MKVSRTLIHSKYEHSSEAVVQKCTVKKMSGKHLCQSLFFNKLASFNFRFNLIKKETLAQVISCEFCEISKNTFFTEYLWLELPSKKVKISEELSLVTSLYYSAVALTLVKLPH